VKITPRAAVLVFGASALALSLQWPTFADTYNHADARHDVERVPQFTQAPRNRESDVTHLQIVHNSKVLRLNVTLRSASLKGVLFRSMGFTLKTSGHRYSGSYIQNHGGDIQYILFDDTAGQEIDATCHESSGRTGRTIWLRIDRACVGHPRWVRVSLGIGTVIGSNDSRGDNALSNNWRRANDNVFTPRIHVAT
jgi:hypothetical protein